jgi:hypothetical protein
VRRAAGDELVDRHIAEIAAERQDIFGRSRDRAGDVSNGESVLRAEPQHCGGSRLYWSAWRCRRLQRRRKSGRD